MKETLEQAASDSDKVQLSILIPCFQEEKNISELVSRIADVMQRTAMIWQLVLIDDGSSDGTWEEINKCRENDSHIRGVRHPVNQGIVPAWESGLMNSDGMWVITMDADLQYAPEDIPSFLQRMDSGEYDLVQGIRVKRNEPVYRATLSILFSWALKLLFAMPFEDVKSGFVLYKREVFGRILEHRHPFRLYQHWIIVAAFYLGFRICQIPIDFHPRTAGQSFITSPIRFGVKASREIPRAFTYFRKLRERSH